jgi:hypothetical protein
VNVDRHVEQLRRAATALRNPYLCNWDPGVSAALAGVFERTADALPGLQSLQARSQITEPHLAHLADLMETVRIARELLRSLGHGCADRPDEPCWSCELTPCLDEGDPR